MKSKSPVTQTVLRLNAPQSKSDRALRLRKLLKEKSIERVPIAWFFQAAALDGKAPLAVALAIWYLTGIKRSTTVELTPFACEIFNVTRGAKYKGLVKLESARLISVQRRPKKNPIVTILPGASDPTLADVRYPHMVTT